MNTNMNNTNNTNWWQRFFSPPPEREYDERARHIGLLAIRDAFIAVIIFIVLTPLALQLPPLQSLSRIGFALLPGLVIGIAGLVSFLSLCMRGGWSWRQQNWQAQMMLYGALVAAGALFLAYTAKGINDPLLPLLVCFIAIPLLIMLLAWRKETDAGASYESHEARANAGPRYASHAQVRHAIIVLAALALFIVAFQFFIQSSIGGLALDRRIEAYLFLLPGIIGVLIYVARTLRLPLPQVLDIPSSVEPERRELMNSRLLLMSILLTAALLLVYWQASSFPY
jgi:hypothetical protein